MAALMSAVRANVAAGMKPTEAQIAAVETALAEAHADLQEISQAVADSKPEAPKSSMDAVAEAMKESAAAIREMAAAVKESVNPKASNETETTDKETAVDTPTGPLATESGAGESNTDLQGTEVTEPKFSKESANDQAPAGFVVDEGARDETKLLEAYYRQQGRSVRVTPLIPRLEAVEGSLHDASGPSTDFELAQRLGEIFGKKVVFVTTDAPREFAGVTFPQTLPNTIFIDIRSRRLAHVIAGHELMHHLEVDAPAVYAKLRKAIDGLLRNHEEYRVSNRLHPNEDVSTEMINDLMGDNFDKREFWNRVAKQSPSAFREIANTVKGWLDRLVTIVKGKLGFGSERFVSDIHAARKALAQALVEYAQRTNARPSNSDTSPKFSREVMPTWAANLTPAQKAALQKTGYIREEQTIGQRVREMMGTFSKSFKQGIFDQFAPIKELGYRQYMLARMAKGSDGGLEAMMMYGKLYLDDGALNVKMEDGGLIGVLQKLQGEHDMFLNWIAGNRAAQLKTEGRENLLTDVDITALKDLNQGVMPDGQRREVLYSAVHKEFNAYMKSVLDIAEQQGLIDHESREVWEKEFYVPFYRNMADGTSGPTVKSGMVGQYAFQKLKGGKDNMKDLMANTLMNWSHLLSASMKNRAALSALETAVNVGAALEVPSVDMAKQMNIGKDVVKVLDQGVHRYFIVDTANDTFLLDAITAMEWQGFKGPVMDAVSGFKRALSFGVTANPTYKIRNLMRDTVSAIAQGDLSYNAAQNLAQGWRLTAHDNPVRASMLAGGALMRFGTVLEGDSAAKTKRLIDAGIDANTVLDTPGKVKAMLEKAWSTYQELGDRGEQVNRAALYQQLRDRGLSHLEASFQARDLMDFSMQGKWTTIRLISQAVPFFNSRLQGFYKLGRAAAEDPARMGYVIGALSLASMSLLLWYRDDDDWKKREDWDRDNYWWFKVGGVAFRGPKPFEMGAIASVAERSLEYLISDERDPGHRFLKSMGNMIGNNLSMNPIPQLVKPLIDLYANQDSFTGRQIETEGMKNLSSGERVGPGTSLPAQLLGKLDPTDNLSPVQIDFLARAYFGWLGTAAMTAVDYGMRPLSGLPAKPADQLRQFPVIGNFIEGLPANQSRYVTLFYDEAKKIDEAYADYRNALKLGNTEKAADLMADKGDLIRQEATAARARRALGALNQQERVIELNRELDPAAKRVLVDAIARKKDELARSIAH